MVVKIANETFSSIDIPIMIVLNEGEKKLISNMGNQNKLCSFPAHYTQEEIIKFMNGNIENEHSLLLH